MATGLEDRVEDISRRLAAHEDREAIRTCLYRINRGMDRIDPDLLTSGFWSDAMIRWATPDYVPFDDWIKTALAMQARTQRVQHLIGNILIDVQGDTANVEAAEIGRHLTPMGEGEMKDLVIAARYIDTFERRDGQWRIIKRDKTGDWIRIIAGSDPMYDHIPLKGTRDGADISFERFGADAFHGLI